MNGGILVRRSDLTFVTFALARTPPHSPMGDENVQSDKIRQEVAAITRDFAAMDLSSHHIVHLFDRSSFKALRKKLWGGFSAGFGSLLVASVSDALYKDISIPNRQKHGIVVAAPAQTLDTAVQFESRGLLEGWDMLDPFQLPHTLPNALAGTLAILLHSQGPSMSCLCPEFSMFDAIETLMSWFNHQRIDSATLACVNDLSAWQCASRLNHARNRNLPDDGAIVLSEAVCAFHLADHNTTDGRALQVRAVFRAASVGEWAALLDVLHAQRFLTSERTVLLEINGSVGNKNQESLIELARRKFGMGIKASFADATAVYGAPALGLWLTRLLDETSPYTTAVFCEIGQSSSLGVLVVDIVR